MFYVFHLIYFLTTIIAAGSIILDNQIGSGASLLAGSFLGWVGGSGARGSLYGTTGQKIVGPILGVVAVAFGTIIANWGQATVWIFDIGFPAPLWVLIGTAIGFIFTRRKDAGV